MAHQVMGSGIDVDMVTGQPASKTGGKKQAATGKLAQAIEKRNQLLIDLDSGGNSIVQLVFERLAKRLQFLALQDPECKVLEGILRDLHYHVELAPLLAEHRIRHLLGEIPFTLEKETAPENGIPAK